MYPVLLWCLLLSLGMFVCVCENIFLFALLIGDNLS